LSAVPFAEEFIQRDYPPSLAFWL